MGVRSPFLTFSWFIQQLHLSRMTKSNQVWTDSTVGTYDKKHTPHKVFLLGIILDNISLAVKVNDKNDQRTDTVHLKRQTGLDDTVWRRKKYKG